MHGGEGSLELEGTRLAQLNGFVQQGLGPLDPGVVPHGAVLVGEQDEITRCVDSRRRPCSMEFHQALTRSRKIRTILPRHEQGGVFAAGGYARATGKAGVCMATSGPGATNLVTPAAYAQLGAMPMLMITGQKPIKKSKQGRFQIIDVVDQYNEPGVFTAFHGFEWTSTPDLRNMHRNVIFRDNIVPHLPLSALDTVDEEKLWAWMAKQEANGSTLLAIPHNSNGSKGQMFEPVDNAGPILSAERAQPVIRGARV